jgi:hypothetical protein
MNRGPKRAGMLKNDEVLNLMQLVLADRGPTARYTFHYGDAGECGALQISEKTQD